MCRGIDSTVDSVIITQCFKALRDLALNTSKDIQFIYDGLIRLLKWSEMSHPEEKTTERSLYGFSTVLEGLKDSRKNVLLFC